MVDVVSLESVLGDAPRARLLLSPFPPSAADSDSTAVHDVLQGSPLHLYCRLDVPDGVDAPRLDGLAVAGPLRRGKDVRDEMLAGLVAVREAVRVRGQEARQAAGDAAGNAAAADAAIAAPASPAACAAQACPECGPGVYRVTVPLAVVASALDRRVKLVVTAVVAATREPVRGSVRVRVRQPVRVTSVSSMLAGRNLVQVHVENVSRSDGVAVDAVELDVRATVSRRPAEGRGDAPHRRVTRAQSTSGRPRPEQAQLDARAMDAFACHAVQAVAPDARIEPGERHSLAFAIEPLPDVDPPSIPVGTFYSLLQVAFRADSAPDSPVTLPFYIRWSRPPFSHLHVALACPSPLLALQPVEMDVTVRNLHATQAVDLVLLFYTPAGDAPKTAPARSADAAAGDAEGIPMTTTADLLATPRATHAQAAPGSPPTPAAVDLSVASEADSAASPRKGAKWKMGKARKLAEALRGHKKNKLSVGSSVDLGSPGAAMGGDESSAGGERGRSQSNFDTRSGMGDDDGESSAPQLMARRFGRRSKAKKESKKKKESHSRRASVSAAASASSFGNVALGSPALVAKPGSRASLAAPTSSLTPRPDAPSSSSSSSASSSSSHGSASSASSDTALRLGRKPPKGVRLDARHVMADEPDAPSASLTVLEQTMDVGIVQPGASVTAVVHLVGLRSGIGSLKDLTVFDRMSNTSHRLCMDEDGFVLVCAE